MKKDSSNPLDPIRKSQEEEYFRKQNQEAEARLKLRAVYEALGIQDTKLMDELWSQGFDGDSIRAIFVHPLVEMAWADGKVQADELKEIWKILEARGITKGSKAHAWVESWLKEGSKAPSYVQAGNLFTNLAKEVKKSENSLMWILTAAERVAKAAHEFFPGLGSSISKSERSMMEKIAKKLEG